MPIYRPTPRVNRPMATMHRFAGSAAPTAAPPLTSKIPHPPAAASLAQSSGNDLMVTWTAPAIDSTHDAATDFNLWYGPSGTDTWTTILGVTSPYLLSGLTVGAAIDIQIQSTNAAGVSGWSATSTLTIGIAAPGMPIGVSLAQGAGSDLIVTWVVPAMDSTHGAATGTNLQSSPSGAATWTAVSNVTSPYDLPGLAAGVPIDVQLQGSNAAGVSGWSASSTLTTATAGTHAPNVPAIASVTPPPDGTTTKLTVIWAAPVLDSTHGIATAFNVRSSPAGAGIWTTVSNVTSPYTLMGLTGAAAVDVEVQAINAAAGPGAWSATTTGTTWGITVAPGGWTAAPSQVHNTGVAPNGGVQMTATPAPTAVAGAVFNWSTSPSIVPTTGLIAANGDGQTNGWGQYFSAPAAAGTFYLWMLAQGSGGVTAGAFVTSAITVS